MDIVVGVTPPVSNDQNRKKGKKRQEAGQQRRDQRKNRHDRRRSVRDGIVVTLSYRTERRSGKDRRKLTY